MVCIPQSLSDKVVSYKFTVFTFKMTSVERISEYSEIQGEWLNATSDLPDNWPSNGSLSLENVSFRHHENLPYVLNNINCSISGGEKVMH